MKNIKITAFLVAFIMCLTNISALAYEPWVENGAICITPVTMADGSELTDVSAGQTITLNAQVKKGSTAVLGQTAQMLIVAYKDGLVADTGKSVVPVSVTDEKQTLTATITVPDGADALKVFVLDNYETTCRPIAEAGVVGNNDVKVSGIYLDGEMIEDFSPDKYSYDVTLNAAYMNYPEIVVQTDDILAKTEIICEDEFPSENSSVKAKVTKNGSEVATYTINFTQEAPAVTNVKLNDADVPSANLVTVAEPSVFSTNFPAEKFYKCTPDITGLNPDEDYPANYICPATSNDQVLHYISPELLGGTMIVTVYDSTGYNSEDALTFRINRSATIYTYAKNGAGMLTLTNPENDYGFVNAKGSPSYYLHHFPELAGTNSDGETDDVGAVLAFKMKISDVDKDGNKDNSNRTREKAWVKKDVIVDPSVGYSDITIPGVGQQYFSTVVKFHDAPLVLNPKVTTDDTTTDTTVLRNLFETVKISDFDTSYAAESYIKDALYFPQVFSDKIAAGITDFDSELVGAESILLPYDVGANTNLEFELNHSAKVYLVSANGLGTTSDWINNSDSVDRNLVTKYFAGTGSEPVEITASNTTVKREYQVVPGETQKVTIDNLPTGQVFVFVQRCELN